MRRVALNPRTLLLCSILALAAGCDSSENGDDSGDQGNLDGGDGEPCGLEDLVAVDESSCAPLDDDYRLDDPSADPYPECIADSGEYTLVADTPGSIARIEAYEAIADLLVRGGEPTREDFIEARTIFDADEGIGSRVARREDLHYPPIPESEHNPGLDPDKQCSDPELAAVYPERCAGPQRIRPIVNQALVDGIDETGVAAVNAARVDAALVWFMYLSVYKESFTCVATPKDCDSSWAYYTGGFTSGEGIGLSAQVAAASGYSHERIWAGVMGVRCWRDLYPDDLDIDTLTGESAEMFETTWEQLDNALHRGLALIVREKLQAAYTCGDDEAANWAWLQIAGPVLDREAAERDPAAAAELAAIWTLEAATHDDRARAVALIDTIFPCG